MRPLAILLICASCFAATTKAAERHALLIGVGAYTSVRALEGPPNDVASLKSLLIGKYGYSPKFVHTLVDRQATKQGIMQALKDLVNEVNPGDYVFFYYSGHGTSFYDPTNKMKQLIAEDTGASLPVDFSASSLDAFGKSVLLGHELRPFFTTLDSKAQVFAVYDSCFSQDSMKALSPGTPKYVALSDAVKGVPKGDLDEAEEVAAKAPVADANTPLPYKHLIAISAAKRDQAALDLGGDKTLDGKAHGQLTNAILMGLNGAADKNHDGIVTHEELFNYVNELSVNWRHNPKLRVSADSDSALQQPAFAPSKSIVQDAGCRHEPAREPKVSAPADLLSALGKGFIPVTEGWDVKAVAQGNGFVLYDAGGIQMNAEPMTRQKALDRLRAEPVITQLSELHYCQQKFNIQLSMNPPDQGKYMQEQEIEFSAKLDRSAYLLVIDIDQEGSITVIYPPQNSERLSVGKLNLLQKTRVQSPYGVDLIKAFAFENKPEGFEKLLIPTDGHEVYLHPGDPRLNTLLKMLSADTPERSETKLRLITTGKD